MEATPAKRRRLSPPPSPSPSPSQQAFFDQLPDSMVEEILLRLPHSSVFASRCVSKLFLSLTTSPYFIQDFCRHRASSNEDPPLGLILQIPCARPVTEFSVCSVVPDNKFSGFSLTFLPGCPLDGNEPITVMGSCHDLILCCNKKRFQSDYFVVNPITRQWVALPPTLRLHEFVLTGLVCDPPSVPEARKGGKLSYRVVRIPFFQKLLTELNVEIFSSEDGQWNEFVVSRAEWPKLCWSSRAVACNGILYWHGQQLFGGEQLMRFDPLNLKQKEISFIQYPQTSSEAGLKKYRLGICQGKLRMCQVLWEVVYSEPSRVKIWELEEGDGSWRLLHEIGVSANSCVQLRKAGIRFGCHSLRPLAFHPSKVDTIYFGCNTTYKIICLDLKRKSLSIVGDYHLELEETLDGWIDVFPFQLPWWPTPVPALPKLNSPL